MSSYYCLKSLHARVQRNWGHGMDLWAVRNDKVPPGVWSRGSAPEKPKSNPKLAVNVPANGVDALEWIRIETRAPGGSSISAAPKFPAPGLAGGATTIYPGRSGRVVTTLSAPPLRSNACQSVSSGSNEKPRVVVDSPRRRRS